MSDGDISKEDFDAYYDVVEHGYADVKEITAVANAAGLSIRKTLEIMNNYAKYKGLFRGEYAK